MTDEKIRESNHRSVQILRYDLSVLRGELKTLWNASRHLERQDDIRVTRQMVDHMDKILQLLDTPTLFHPTLF